MPDRNRRMPTATDTTTGASAAGRAAAETTDTLQMAVPASAATDRRTTSLWGNVPYLLLMTGKTGQLIGTGVATFAVPLIAFAVTSSVFLAGLITAVAEIGLLVAMLPAGALADRVNRKRLIVIGAVIGAALWASLAMTDAAGALTGWQLAITLGAASAVTAFYGPAESASIRYVVPSEQLGSAMAAMQGRSAAASLAAAPLGGLLYGLSRSLPFVAGILGYLVAGVTALAVRTPLNDPPSPERENGAGSIAEGIRFVLGVPFLRLGVVVFAAINLAFDGVVVGVNLHLVATHTAPLAIAMVDVAVGITMLVGSVLAPTLVKRFRTGWLTVACLLPSGLGAVGMAMTDSYTGFIVWSCVMSALIPTVNAGLLGYAAAITPQSLQARMSSVVMISSLAVAPIAPVIAGWALPTLGVPFTLCAFGGLLLASTVALGAARSVRRIGRPDTWEADAIVPSAA
ncbi:MFS transporter [Rathayibacter sp. CAU 1779]